MIRLAKLLNSKPLHRLICSKASQSLINESLIPLTNGNLALVSLSTDIYYNLALEQYIADNYDFQNRSVLLLWQNEPCVVIGRYQNAWQECNLVEMKKRNIKLARRASGGGCVYHDLGNLNCTFFTTRDRYNRQFNLKMMKSALEKLDFKNINFHISPRHDIFIEEKNGGEQFKVSGTSARVSKNYSYHHCTVLFDVELSNMSVIKSNFTEKEIISSRGTASVRSKTRNLSEFALQGSVNMSKIIGNLACEYWSNHSSSWSIQYLYNYINPKELNSIESTSHFKEFTAWEYIYGHTPKFQLKLDLDDVIPGASMVFFVENGTIVNIETANFNHKYLDQFTTHAYLLHNVQLKRDLILDIFKKHDLLTEKKKLFQAMYHFFDKNFI